jgi:hypothetical protein
MDLGTGGDTPTAGGAPVGTGTTKAQISQILGVLGVVYRRQALTTQELKLAVPVWHELLGDLDFHLLKAAVHAHCTTSKWFPSVAELRQAAHDLVAPAAEAVTAGEAWAEVKRAIRLGQHRFQDGQARWSSPLVEAAFNALGGWNYFRTALTDDEMADRAHFTRAYEGLQRRQHDQARMHPAARRFRQGYLESARQLPGDNGRHADRPLEPVPPAPSPVEGPAPNPIEGSPAEGPIRRKKRHPKQVPVHASAIREPPPPWR